MQPAIFVSHGSPMMAIEDNVTTEFFTKLGQQLEAPKAVIVFSAHFDRSDAVYVTGAENLSTIHDFYGFPQPLYQIQYPAKGKTELTDNVVERLTKAGFPVKRDDQIGLDHGAWIPLKFMYPNHDIPVVSVSINSRASAGVHYFLGEQLRTLREEGVLILGSGGISHNLREIFSNFPDAKRVDKVNAFVDWAEDAVKNRDVDALTHYMEKAPHASFNHPSPDHYLPLPSILGASYEHEHGRKIHKNIDLEILALDAYQFGA